jgi:hypothetical protein
MVTDFKGFLIDWDHHPEMVACQEDLHFAERNGMTREQVEAILAVFDKAVGFESCDITLPELIEKICYEVPGFEKTLDLERIYRYWKGRRRDISTPLLRQFWPRYEM